MKHLKEWSFGIDNDKLVSLVLQGKKTATTSLYEIDEVPEVGEESILVLVIIRKHASLGPNVFLSQSFKI